MYLSPFATRRGESREVLIKSNDLTFAPPLLWLSPDGRYLVLKTMPADIPESWKDYKDRLLQIRVLEKRASSAPRFIYRYEIVDTRSGSCEPLLDAPIGMGHSEVAWSSDSRSVVVCGASLPLDVSDPTERKMRQSNRFIAEIKVPSREVIPIGKEEGKLSGLKAQTNEFIFESTVRLGTADLEGQVFAYRKTAAGWQKLQAATSDLPGNDRIGVTLEEDMNTPPRVFVTNRHTGERALLLDLNPEFRKLKFGQVKEVSFEATTGQQVKGGLYLPPDYVSGTRFSVVIQTHGWNPERFWPDGPYPSRFAAQALAGKGIVVLQLEEDLTQQSPLAGVQQETSAHEDAIVYLYSMVIG